MKGKLKGGRYEIEEQIGRGGMGVVYRARDTRLKRIVALKMLPADVARDAEFCRRLTQEARAASAISHPGIATVFDFEEHGGESFIVYEYVEGETLRDRLERRRPSSEEILELGIQLADALSAAHARGVIHRDLKPENVMLVLAEEGLFRVKILDFGLAKLRPPVVAAPGARGGTTETAAVLTSPGMMVGTVNYMAPEQVAGEAADARTDLYGLGLVLYEAATGINPFLGSQPTSTIANILTREPPPVLERNPEAPAEFGRIVRKCLRKRPEERFQSARELLVDLANLRRDLAARAASPGAAERSVTVPAPAPLAIARGLARGLFLLIQLGYLAMYAVAFHNLIRIEELPTPLPARNVAIMVATFALCGVVLRLYFLSAVTFDWPDTGRLFRQLFGGILILDVGWALTPLLLFRKIGFLALLFIAGLAYLPFSQRTLLFSAYAPRGGRTSGVKAPGAP